MEATTVPDMLGNRTEDVLCSTASVLTMKADFSRAFGVFLASTLFTEAPDDTKTDYLNMFESINEIVDQAHLQQLAIMAQGELNSAKEANDEK